MIDRLYEIAKLENDPKKDIYSKSIDKFPENIDPENFRLLILSFEESNGNFQYKGVDSLGIRADNKDILAKQLWKINSKGNSPVPCACYSCKKPHTFINKLIRFFESTDKGIDIPSLHSSLKSEKNKIIDQVNVLVRKTTWVSLKLNNKFLSEIKGIDDKIKEYINKKEGFTKKDGHFKKGTCYLCHTENANLVDKFEIPNMKFGTFDKKENISMNFKSGNEYKMCSVCLDCQKLFNQEFSNILLKQEGYVTNFYGLRTIVLPSFITDNNLLNQFKDGIKRYNYESKIIKNEFKAMSKLKKDLKKLAKDSINKKELEKKEKTEMEIKSKSLDVKYTNTSNLGVVSNYLDRNLIFSMVLFDSASSQFIIYDVIEDVSKTKLTTIANVHKRVLQKFNQDFGIDLILYYKMLLKYKFDKESKDINKYIKQDFIYFIKKLLMSSQISKEKLTDLFMNYINKEFYNRDDTKRDLFLCFETKKFKALLEFLSELNCLEVENEK